MAEGGSHNVFSFDGAENVQVFLQGRTDRVSQGSNNGSNNNRGKLSKDPSSKLESDGRPVYETNDDIRSSANEKIASLGLQPDPSVREKIGKHRKSVAPESDDNMNDMHQRPESSLGISDCEGWFNLSSNIKIDNNNPLKKGATVFRGRKKFMGGWRDVAIKLISYDETSSREVEFLLKLERHPNVILVYDADVFRHPLTSYIYIVMEFCPKTLKDHIDECKGKKFDFAKNWSYGKQLVEGVAYIHKNNILHRDIKLENILLTKSGDYLRVADFGLSKKIMENQSVANISSRGMGSEGFQAPEILQENPTASFYSDAYSIGIVLALLFSEGYHPFGSDPNRWRTNIIDHKGLDFSHIEMFDKSYDGKRNELIRLLEQIITHDQRSRLRPEHMLRSPFFESLEVSGKERHRLIPQTTRKLDVKEKSASENASSQPILKYTRKIDVEERSAILKAIDKMTVGSSRHNNTRQITSENASSSPVPHSTRKLDVKEKSAPFQNLSGQHTQAIPKPDVRKRENASSQPLLQSTRKIDVEEKSGVIGVVADSIKRAAASVCSEQPLGKAENIPNTGVWEPIQNYLGQYLKPIPMPDVEKRIKQNSI